jgi:GR25 family glycosyltransferase involved in LPS biosynthesis
MTVFTVKSHVDHEVTRDQKKLGACSPPSLKSLMAREALLTASSLKARQAASSFRGSSFLHEVVGENGVLQMSLERTPERATYSAEKLESVGISPTAFPATDVECTPQNMLDEACNEFCSAHEAAIAHSHKRALEFAAQRKHEWTAILEDDAVPVLVGQMTSGSWDAELRRIWSQLPANARIVRLSWCVPNSEDWYLAWSNAIGDESNAEKMKFTQFVVENSKAEIYNSVGLCTTAYVVHRDIIPELLQTFPCNCAFDACLGWKFFNRVDSGGAPYSTYLYNLDVGGSADLTWSLEPEHSMNWYGAMRQAHETLGSTVGWRAQLLQKQAARSK